MDFGAISHAFERKILRPRNNFDNFDRNSHAIFRFRACRRSAQLLGTSEGRKRAAHHQAAWISARSRASSNAKFRRREKKSKISAIISIDITCNLTLRSIKTLGLVVGDLYRSEASCATAGSMIFGAISQDFERKISPPRKITKISIGIRMQSHAPQHADARHSC